MLTMFAVLKMKFSEPFSYQFAILVCLYIKIYYELIKSEQTHFLNIGNFTLDCCQSKDFES